MHPAFHPRSGSRRGLKAQRGAIAVAFAVLFVLLLGMVGLGFDSGRLFVAKSELQNAADACALAAVSALTGASDAQLAIAEARGIEAGIVNRVGMQGSPAVFSIDSSVTFATDLTAPFVTKGAVAAPRNQRYVRCTTSLSGIAPILLRVLDLLPSGPVGNGSASASATASLQGGNENCSLPIGICGRAASLRVGDWVIGKMDMGSISPSLATGFVWVGFTPSTTTSDLEAQLGNSGQCALINSATTVYRAVPGALTTLVEAWNMRFGVEKNNPGVRRLPDQSGYWYTPQSEYFSSTPPSTLPTPPSNVYADFQNRRTRFESGSSVSNPGVGMYRYRPSGGYAYISSSEHRSLGTDRRMAVVPIVDCTNVMNGTPTPVVEWACALLLHPAEPSSKVISFEYRGPASSGASGCVTAGLPGGDGPVVPTLVQ